MSRLAGLVLAHALAASAAAGGGVVVEAVARGSSAEQAGIQPGDVIAAWSRGPASGAIETPFDLASAELEQAPRGPVLLHGTRGAAASTWTLGPRPPGLTSRPALDDGLLARHREALGLAEARRAADAAALWRRAAGEAAPRGGPLQAAWLLSRAARALADARAWAEADEAYEAAASAAEREAAPGTAAQLLRDWGTTLASRGEWSRAEDCYQRALALEQARGAEGLAVADTLNRLGALARSRDALDAAEQHHRRALAIRERLAPGSLDVATSLSNLGVVFFVRGDLEAAGEHARRALAIRETLAPAGRDAAASHNNLGVIARRRGDLAAAEWHYGRALGIFERLSPESFETARLHSNLGALALEREDLPAAQGSLQRAAALLETLAPGSFDLANALDGLGRLAGLRKDVAAAEDYGRRALAIREKLVPEGYEVARSLNNLALIHMDAGELAPAEEYLRRALAIKQALSPDSLEVAVALGNLANVLAERGELAAAEQSQRRALAIRERLAAGTAEHAESLYGLAHIHRRSGRPALASELLLRAIDAIERQRTRLGGTEESRSGFLAKYASYYHDAIDALVEQGRPAEAVALLERSRARSLLALLAERALLFAAELPAELARERGRIDGEYERVQAAIARLSPMRDGPRIDTLLGRLQELRAEQERIVDRVRAAAPRLASVQYPQPLDLAGVRRALDPGTVLLAYSVGARSTLLLVVRAAGAPGPGVAAFRIAADQDALREQVERLRGGIESHDAEGRAELDARAASLYDLLLGPAERELRGSARLLLSPDGPLHGLPFAALRRRPAGRGRARYLVEWKPLHVVASATVYAELKRSRRQAGAPRGALAAFGDPRYPAFAQAGTAAAADPQLRSALTRGVRLAPLPASRDEVDGIARLFAGARKYLGEAATEERAKAVGRGVRYVHFACHSVLDERFPLDSALALTIPEQPAEGQDNGLLQAWEVFERVRLDAELVTLSACRTGLGREVGGEGLLGLSRAFLYAGARSVLASLWAVADDSTAVLMKRFYRSLKAGGSRDEALRAAQLGLIREAARSHPFHWAAFQLSGDRR